MTEASILVAAFWAVCILGLALCRALPTDFGSRLFPEPRNPFAVSPETQARREELWAKANELNRRG